MDFLNLTKRYYAAWLDVDPLVLDEPGVVAVASPQREERQAGYSRSFALYCFVSGGTTVISYAPQLQPHIGHLQRQFEQGVPLDAIKATLAESCGVPPKHSYKYYFTALPARLDTTQARPLTREDYSDFFHFHKRLYPDGNQENWLVEYFRAIAGQGYVYGVYVNARLVSATDVPDLPYMRDVMVEPGINTLPEYRRRGYAKVVVGALLKHLLKTHKVPLWSCSCSNSASQNLAERVGYVKFADVITVTC